MLLLTTAVLDRLEVAELEETRKRGHSNNAITIGP